MQAPSGLAQADVIHPDTLRLPQVKTPRKQANTAFDKAASPREPSGSGGKAAAEQVGCKLQAWLRRMRQADLIFVAEVARLVSASVGEEVERWVSRRGL